MTQHFDERTPVSIAMSPDEALVTFEFLSRLIEEREGADLIALAKHDAEIWALDRLLGKLQRELAQPFHPDYDSLVNAAQRRLSEACGGRWPGSDA